MSDKKMIIMIYIQNILLRNHGKFKAYFEERCVTGCHGSIFGLVAGLVMIIVYKTGKIILMIIKLL